MVEDLVVMLTGKTRTLAEACQILEIDPIVKRFGTWAVTEYGVECLTTHYAIPKDRVNESNWERHLEGKTWTVADDAADAIRYAREYFRPRVARVFVQPPIHQSRSRKKSLSSRLRFLILKRDGYRCQLCGVAATQGVLLEVDHKVARANGGTDSPENLWTLCQPCNNGKGTHEL